MSCRYRSRSRYSVSGWLDETNLTGGSDWRSDYARATVALTFITVFALIGICIWAVKAPKRTLAARRIYRWFMLAIVTRTIFFLWTAIDAILVEECASVQQLYSIFDILFKSLDILSLVFLLAAIFVALVPLKASNGDFHHEQPNLSRPQKGFCGFLLLLWLVILCLVLAATIEVVEGTGSSTVEIAIAATRLALVFSVFYLLAAIYVLIMSIVIVRHYNGPDRKKTSLAIILLISIPLFIKAVWTVATDAILNDFFNYYSTFDIVHVFFAAFIFLIVCLTAIFAGLVILIKSIYAAPSYNYDDFENMGNMHQQQQYLPTQTYHSSTVPRAAELPGTGTGTGTNWDSQSATDHSQDPIVHYPQAATDGRHV